VPTKGAVSFAMRVQLQFHWLVSCANWAVDFQLHFFEEDTIEIIEGVNVTAEEKNRILSVGF
jgi:hypothetical protein